MPQLFRKLGYTVDDYRAVAPLYEFTRSFTVAKSRIQGIFEIYNLTNTRPSQANQTTFNANWLQPSVLLGGRLFKFGAQVDW